MNMTSPRESAAQSRAEPSVRLTIDEATVVLGLLDLLEPPALPESEPALLALVGRTRHRLATAIATAMNELHDGGIRLA